MAVSTPIFSSAPAAADDRLENARAALKARVASSNVRSSCEYARALCGAVLTEYWRRRLEGRGLEWQIRTPPNEAGLAPRDRALATDVSEFLAPLSTEQAGYLAGVLYTSLLPPEVRARLGAYYTPPALVTRLIENVTELGFDWARGCVLDPSCGGAAFLAPLARQIASALKAEGRDARSIIRTVAERVRGIEIDPFAAWMSMVLLELELLDTSVEAGCRVPDLIAVGDALKVCSEREELFLETGRGHRFDLVIGNPPYGRISLSPQMRKRFGRSLYGHANLYGIFTHVALRLSSQDAIVAYVTPTSFLGGEYFKRLRSLLRKEAPPAIIEFVTERTGVFEDVLQETLLVVFKKRTRQNQEVLVRSLRPNGAGAAVTVEVIGRVKLPAGKEEEAWLFPRRPQQRAALLKALSMKHRLSDYGFVVNTGQLVWNRHKSQLKESPGPERLPLIWAEAVTPGGEFRFSATQREHKPYFELKPKQGHLVTREPCVLVQRTTAKEQNRRLVAAVLPESFLAGNPRGVVIENHLNIVKSVTAGPRICLETLSILLNSRAVDSLFRCINGSVAVSAFELNAIPLPGPKEMERLTSMVKEKREAREVQAYIDSIYGLAGT